jgi:hypothetical protein
LCWTSRKRVCKIVLKSSLEELANPRLDFDNSVTTTPTRFCQLLYVKGRVGGGAVPPVATALRVMPGTCLKTEY